jgi:hypothetical protein
VTTRRLVLGALLVVGVVLVAAAVPVAGIELACKSGGPPRPAAPSRMAEADRRALGDSYMSFPEWDIVYAYADLAGVMRQSSESSFDYFQAIGGFWSSLCGATRTASSLGPVTLDQTVTDHIIGLSFTAEMAIKGAWERTIGAVAVWSRGPDKTPEDVFALDVAEDYAAFLHQTPWYRYPFGEKLRALWTNVPFRTTHLFRSIERRVALTLEYGGKAVYAKAMDWLAGYSPANLRLRSLVRDLRPEDIAASPAITPVGSPLDGLSLIETPRYEAYTDILRILAARMRDVEEIAGNRRILTTIVAPVTPALDTEGARTIFSMPIQSRPGWQRLGLDTDVAALTRQIRRVEEQGAVFEHAYDY